MRQGGSIPFGPSSPLLPSCNIPHQIRHMKFFMLFIFLKAGPAMDAGSKFQDYDDIAPLEVPEKTQIKRELVQIALPPLPIQEVPVVVVPDAQLQSAEGPVGSEKWSRGCAAGGGRSPAEHVLDTILRAGSPLALDVEDIRVAGLVAVARCARSCTAAPSSQATAAWGLMKKVLRTLPSLACEDAVAAAAEGVADVLAVCAMLSLSLAQELTPTATASPFHDAGDLHPRSRLRRRDPELGVREVRDQVVRRAAGCAKLPIRKSPAPPSVRRQAGEIFSWCLPHGGSRCGACSNVRNMQISMFSSLAQERTRVCQRRRSSSSARQRIHRTRRAPHAWTTLSSALLPVEDSFFSF